MRSPHLQSTTRAGVASLRILHVIDTFAPEAGGPPEFVRLLARGYKAIGAEMEVLCLDRPDAEYLREIPCRVHALGQRYFGRYAFSPRLWLWLRENAGRYDGIVMNGVWTFPGLALHLAARRAGTRYGVFAHGALDPWFNRRYPLKQIKKWLYWPFQYRVLRDAAAVFFTARMERDVASTSFWPNSWNGLVVPFGIYDPEEGADAERQIDAFYEYLPKLRGRRYFLFLGRMHEKKGCDLLIEAFARVAPAAPDMDLVMAGPDQMELQSRLAIRAAQLGIAERVYWTGMIGGDLKWGALRACEAFVLPSHQENFGISVVEALAVGRPVLISNQVNIWPEIEADGVGLVDHDTVSGTENLLRRWLELPAAERREIAQHARPSFLSRFDVNRAAVAINTVFAQGISDPSAALPQPPEECAVS